jgi:excisionase family DNA binding protein
MATVAGQGARYGSPAELAAYGGVSVKTIRRLADAEKIRKLRVGRRVVIPYADFDAHVSEQTRSPAMQATLSRPAFDHRGRALPLPPEEERRRAEEGIRALDALASMGDDGEQAGTFAALAEAIDRAPMSDRRRFSG